MDLVPFTLYSLKTDVFAISDKPKNHMMKEEQDLAGCRIMNHRNLKRRSMRTKRTSKDERKRSEIICKCSRSSCQHCSFSYTSVLILYLLSGVQLVGKSKNQQAMKMNVVCLTWPDHTFCSVLYLLLCFLF